MGSLRGDEARAEARLGEGDDGLGPEHLGGAAGGLRHGLRETVGLGAGGGQRGPRQLALDAGSHARHDLHGLHGMLTGGGLGGEHDGVRALEDGRGHIRYLGAGGPQVRDHGLEHLGRHDDGHLGQPRLPDDVALDDRHLLQRHLDAEVTAGDHDGVHEGQDTGEVGDHLGSLELGDDGDARPAIEEEFADLLNVGGRAHERHRDVVDAMGDPEAEILAVLVGETRHGQRDPGEGHALVVGDDTARDDAAHGGIDVRPLHGQLDGAIVHPQLIAGLEGGDQIRMVERGALGGAQHRLGGKGKELPRHEHGAPADEISEPDLGPLEILDDGHRPAPVGLALTNGADDGGMLLVGAVGEIQARHIHARLHELAQGGGVPARRPDGADDTRAPSHLSHFSFSPRLAALLACGSSAASQLENQVSPRLRASPFSSKCHAGPSGGSGR